MKTVSTKAPVMFIAHGAPTFALKPEKLGQRLGELGRLLPDVKVVLVVSPHWQSHELRVMTTSEPGTIHDFGGFDPELYGIRYRVAGHPALAHEAGQLLAEAGLTVRFDDSRGLDHGAWVPLVHLLPEGNRPVFQISMPVTLDPAGAFQLGRILAPLRDRGVMILGSGNLTHNLFEFRQLHMEGGPYIDEFTAWVQKAVLSHDIEQLLNYRNLAPHASRAHPTEEHYLPLLVAMGACDGEPTCVIDGGVTHGVLAMESYAWGLPDTVDTESIVQTEVSAKLREVIHD
jgi:4,5-DOPA dioxygenase extradiol